jgi:hypothetical protein
MTRGSEGQGAIRRCRRRRTTVLVGAAACALLLGACGTTDSGSPSSVRGLAGGSHRAAATVSGTGATTGVDQAQAVTSAWMAAEQAFETAALDADPSEPALAATTLPPQLPWSESLLARMRASGEVALGPVQFGPVHVVSLGRSLATVRSCIHDAEVVLDGRTGEPVAGQAGQVDDEVLTSTMEITSGGWKLATQTVVEVNSCAGH